MRILKVHNYYLQPGGEDTVFQAETSLLRSMGHEVVEYIETNERIALLGHVSVALQTIWSQSSYVKFKKILKQVNPQIVHFHNIFPLISPSVYYACNEMRIPVVQTLDNQRLICPSANFFRDGKLCLECMGKTPPYPGILHACYHNSHLHTAVVAAMLTFHRWLQTWRVKVDVFLCSTQFYRGLFALAGLPAEKLVVMPHFVSRPLSITSSDGANDYALFVGRLDPEKGIDTMLKAWSYLDFPLKIRGSGRLVSQAKDFVKKNDMKYVEFVGRLEEQELSKLIGLAKFLLMPSEGYYETFGMVIVEAYSRGVPVIASNIGVVPELVSDKQTGLLFEPGNPQDLADKARWMWDHPREAGEMGRKGLGAYEEKFTPDRCYKTLIGVYERLVNTI
jgi:glycosyltransferase involved in cell wall biosynthesis